MEERKLGDLLMDFVSLQEHRGKAGSYAESILKAIKSWLSYNRRKLDVKIKIKGARDTPSLKGERIPSKHELTRILFAGDKKTRTASVLLAHAGLRIQALGNYDGTDGLRVGDLPEMRLNQEGVRFERIPTIVLIRRELSKAGHKYFTFLSDEGCGYLRDYLEERIRRGERLTEESAIITPKKPVKPFIRTANIGDAIRKAIRRAGFSWRPYVLRAYFATQLMLAENEGKVIRDFRQFWMGHKGDIEARYTTNKSTLPESVVEEMRSAYRKSQEHLETTKPEVPSVKEELRHQIALIAGFKAEEIERLKSARMSDEEFQAKLREKLTGNKPCQKIVPLEELEDHLAHGWEFVAALPNGKAIIKSL